MLGLGGLLMSWQEETNDVLSRYYRARFGLRDAAIKLTKRLVKIIPMDDDQKLIHLGGGIYLDNTKNERVISYQNNFGRLRIGPSSPTFDERAMAQFVRDAKLIWTQQSSKSAIRWLLDAKPEFEGGERAYRKFKATSDELIGFGQRVAGFLLQDPERMELATDEICWTVSGEKGVIFNNGLEAWIILGPGAVLRPNVHAEFIQFISAAGLLLE
jgi:hypothetical protein